MIIGLICLIMGAAVTVVSAEETASPFPFERIDPHNGTILATFPSSGIRWVVKLNSEASHISNYNETIELHGNDFLVLQEKHSSVKIIAVLTGCNPGLQITKSCDSQLGNKTETVFYRIFHK